MRITTLAVLFLTICCMSTATSGDELAREAQAAPDFSTILVHVTPRWLTKTVHPVYPVKETYRIDVGTRRPSGESMILLGLLELRAGEEKAAEWESVAGVVVRVIAKIDASGERASVKVRGERDGTIVFDHETNVWLPKKPDPRP